METNKRNTAKENKKENKHYPYKKGGHNRSKEPVVNQDHEEKYW